MSDRNLALIIPGLGENRACYNATISYLHTMGYDPHFINLTHLIPHRTIGNNHPIAAIAHQISKSALDSDLKFGFCLAFSIGASIAMNLDEKVFEHDAVQLLIDPIVFASPERLATIKSANLALREKCHLGYPLEWKNWREEDRKAKSNSLKGWPKSTFTSVLPPGSAIDLDHQTYLQNPRSFIVIPSSSNLSGVDWSKEELTRNLFRLNGGHEIQREDPMAIFRTIGEVLQTRLR